jgi:ABC-type multidrug transport system ATPase subunit
MLQIDTQPHKDAQKNREETERTTSPGIPTARTKQKPEEQKKDHLKHTNNLHKQTKNSSNHISAKDTLSNRITFKEITYKSIIKNISHTFKSGEMTAILGPSGAGKTTYLKIAAGRKRKTAGQIVLNGQEIKQKELRKKVAYVHQEDHHYPNLTAKEMLVYTIKLKSPTESNPSELADRLLSEMGMAHVKDTLIGDPLEGDAGLSGGERKRLSVAQELISCVDTLFLDEPTSGLDSYTSESLIIHLKSLSQMGILVAMTIHQPSSDIFYMFDNIIVMKDGYIVYSGSPANSLRYLEEIGHGCPKYTNPADHIFRVLNKLPAPDTKSVNIDCTSEIDLIDEHIKKKTTLFTLWHEIKILISRTALCSIRNKRYIYAKSGHALFVALITGLFLYNIPAKMPHQIETNVIGCYRTITMATFGSFSYGAISILFSDRKIFLKEYGSHYYTFLPYFISKLVVDFMITAMHPIVGVPIVFYLSGIGSVSHMLGCLLLGGTAHALGVLISSFVDTSEIALAIFPGFAYFINMLTGTDVDPDSIVSWLKYLQYISPPRHAYNIMIKLHYQQSNEPLSPRIAGLVNGFVSIKTSVFSLIMTYFILITLAGYSLRHRVKILAKG